MKFVRVKDGEDLIVVVSHEPSAYDPSGEVLPQFRFPGGRIHEQWL